MVMVWSSCSPQKLTWATPHASPTPMIWGVAPSAPSKVAGHRQSAALANPVACTPALLAPRGRCRLSLVGVAATVQDDAASSGHSAASSKAPDAPEHADATREPLVETEPWTIQQFFSVLSGILGSILSASAFSRQREAAKGRLRSGAAIAVGRQLSAKNARIVQQLGGSLLDAEAQSPLFSLGPVPQCTDASNIRRKGRHFTIITTAALPWLTGTAVNPLLRALSLAKSGRPVVLVLPWLSEADQRVVFPKGKTFDDKQAQEETIRAWCRDRAKTDPAPLPLQFRWYQAKYVANVRSIFPTGDCSNELGEGDPRDVLILEEPEHLCWYHHGQRWPGLFRHVIGIVHTNYQDYLVQHHGVKTGDPVWDAQAALVPDEIKEASVFAASTMVCSAYCDVNIKLSDTIMPLPNEVTCNVHGVRQEFLFLGDRCSMESGPALAYYLGKALFEKGWGEMLELLRASGNRCEGLHIDGFGSGPDYEEIIERSASLGEGFATMTMHPGLDHASEPIHKYAVLINASTSDVLCTVTVEALAMGKRCVLAQHPSNRFFEDNFPNRCFFFDVGDADGFATAVHAALACGPPEPLPADQRHALTWDAANERLFTAAEVRVLSGRFQRPSEAAASRLAYQLHHDTMRDRTVLADLIKEATLGEKTPWDEYFAEWRRTQLGKLRDQVVTLQPDHLQEHETYLRERIQELASAFKGGR